jgi:small subunit ribosomal protein S8
MYSDPIADLLTRIRNAQAAGHRIVTIPGSRLKLGIVKVLFEQGYITAYKFVTEGAKTYIKVALKYDPISKRPGITEIQRISRPGLRAYSGVEEIPRAINGLGIVILSTSKGVMTDKHARRENVGGELLCYVY